MAQALDELLSPAEIARVAELATPDEWKELNVVLGNWGFRRYYAARPLEFVHDCFDWYGLGQPTDYQCEAISHFNYGRTAIYGPRGLGKTALDAWFVLWFALTRDGDEDWKLPTTASNWRQLNKFLWPEIRKWARKIKWDMVHRGPFDPRTEMLQMNLKLKTGEAFAAASKNSEELEGAHAQHLGYLFDESKIVPATHFDSVEGAFSNAGVDGHEAIMVATSTPGEPNGRFYEICSGQPGYDDWKVIRVTIEDTIKARRISPKWVDQRRRQWGQDSALFQQQVLGRFYASATDSVIPLPWIEMAVDRWLALRDQIDTEHPRSPVVKNSKYPIVDVDLLTHLGVDCGYGGDANAIAYRYGPMIRNVEAYVEANTMALAGRLKAMLERCRAAKAVIDVIGYGAGVVDRLREQGLGGRVIPFNAGSAARESNGEPMMDQAEIMSFVNLRSAAWWHLRELLDPSANENPDTQLLLPPDDTLIGDLTAPKWGVTSAGKIKIEEKDDIRKRLGRSTDKGDAVVQSFAKVPFGTGPLTIAYRGTSGWFARD